MRIRAVGPAVFVVAALVMGACTGGGASPTPGATGTAAATATAAASPSPTPKPPCKTGTGAALPPAADLKIGMVADIGSLTDKNFNEYTHKGTQDAATALGAAEPAAVVAKSASEYTNLVQQLVDAGNQIIVTTGFNLANATVEAACANPDVWFVGVDQSPICVDPSGHADGTFQCKGKASELLPRYVSIMYQEDQPGYLVGIVAAMLSQSGKIGAIGGTSACAPCIRYIQGYELGAKSVNPNIEVNSKYVVSDFSNDAFHNAALGKTFTQTFLTQFPGTDVFFQVAGETGNGVLEAACAAGAAGIGVDVDQWLSLKADTTPTYQCIVTSAEKKLQLTVSAQIQAIQQGTAKGGDVLFNAANDGIGYSPDHQSPPKITSAIQAAVDAALEDMKATPPLVTCPAPPQCGSLATPAPGGSPTASPSTSP
jgi:basic membrane protein A and related proteins